MERRQAPAYRILHELAKNETELRNMFEQQLRGYFACRCAVYPAGQT